MAEIIIINPREKTDVATGEVKVAAYVRVSSDSEDQENSFITQYDYYVAKINKTPNYRLVDIYADNGISGTELERRNAVSYTHLFQIHRINISLLRSKCHIHLWIVFRQMMVDLLKQGLKLIGIP